jgi:hypothetical protein
VHHKKWYRYYFHVNVRLQNSALEDVDVIKEGRFFHHKTGFAHFNLVISGRAGHVGDNLVPIG